MKNEHENNSICGIIAHWKFAFLVATSLFFFNLKKEFKVECRNYLDNFGIDWQYNLWSVMCKNTSTSSI